MTAITLKTGEMNGLKSSLLYTQSLTQAICHTRSITKKAYHTAATACLGFSVTCGSSMITPATPEIAEHFHVSRTVSILALSLFVLGLAVGPMIAAPISETYGRSVVYKVSACVFMLFILGAGFSESLASLLVCRFLAGAIGGPVLAVGAGTNADMYNARNRAVASSLFIMMPVSTS
jgi:MFS family permease